MKSSNNKSNKANRKNQPKRGVGRPYASVNVPNKRFTFNDLKAANPSLAPLTLRNFIDRHISGRKSLLVNTGETKAPESGMGRPSFIYMKRSLIRTNKTAKTVKPTVTTASVPLTAPAANPPSVTAPVSAPAASTDASAPASNPAPASAPVADANPAPAAAQ